MYSTGKRIPPLQEPATCLRSSAFWATARWPWGARWLSVCVRRWTNLGLSQKQSATRTGVDPATLAKWEQGKREPNAAFLVRVNRFLEGDTERRSNTPGRIVSTPFL